MRAKTAGRGRWLAGLLLLGALAAGLVSAARWSYDRTYRQAAVVRTPERSDDEPARGGDEWLIRVRSDDPSVVQHVPPPTFGADAITLGAAALVWFALAAAVIAPQFDWSPRSVGSDEYGYGDR